MAAIPTVPGLPAGTQIPDVSQMLGQMATSPPIGPIPTTPYAPVNVAPIWQAPQPTSKPPKPVKQQQNPFGFGQLMQPQTGASTATIGGGGPRGDRNTVQSPVITNPQSLQQILQRLGVPQFAPSIQAAAGQGGQ